MHNQVLGNLKMIYVNFFIKNPEKKVTFSKCRPFMKLLLLHLVFRGVAQQANILIMIRSHFVLFAGTS